MLPLTLLLVGVGAGARLAFISMSDEGGPDLAGARNVLLTSPFVGTAVLSALIALR
jgi:hypothetical protein